MTAPGRPNSPLGRVSPVSGFTDGGDEGGTIPAHYTGTAESLAYGHDPASDLDANDGQVRLVVRLDPGQTLIMNPEPVVIVRDPAAYDLRVAQNAVVTHLGHCEPDLVFGGRSASTCTRHDSPWIEIRDLCLEMRAALEAAHKSLTLGDDQ